MSKIEINIDSTVLGSAGCIKQLILKTVGTIENGQPTGGFKEHGVPIKMGYGICVHKFIDEMYKSGGHYPIASKAALDMFNGLALVHDKKSTHLSDTKHLLTTCYGVWSHIENDSEFEVMMINGNCYKCKGQGALKIEVKTPQEGNLHETIDNITKHYRLEQCSHCNGAKQLMQPATEITFSLPYFKDDYVKINLCGTIDRIGKIRGGCYCIRDWKTTSSWDNNNYFKSYELSRQLRIYTLACKIMSRLHPDSILGKIGATNMGAAIDAIFLKPKANDNAIRSSVVFQYKELDLQLFEWTLEQICKRLSTAVKELHFPKEGIANGNCEMRHGKCSFWNVCAADDSVSQILLKRDFEQKKFNPLAYNEIG